MRSEVLNFGTRETLAAAFSASILPFAAISGNIRGMSTITAILEADVDGTLHLPLPAEWRKMSIRVKAELEPVEAAAQSAPGEESLKGFGCLRGKIRMAPDFDEPLEDFKDYMG